MPEPNQHLLSHALSGPLWRQLVRLAIPAASTALLETLVFLADRLMLGRYSQQALASMQVQGPVVWSLFSVFMGLCVGGVSVVARSIGARDTARAHAASRSVIRLALLAGLVVAVVGFVTTPTLVELVGPDSAQIRELSVSYLRWALVGFPGLFVATGAAMVLGASGDTKTPFWVALISNALNLLLNQLLIFGSPTLHIPSLGVAGAAISSSLAFSVQALLLLRVMRRPASQVCVIGFLQLPTQLGQQVTREVLRLSYPVLLERSFFHLGFVAYAAVISRMGVLVMASNQALITLESICFLSVQGFGVATSAVVGQAVGRGDLKQARRAGWLGAALAALALSAAGAVIWLTAPVTLGVFVPAGQSASALISEALVAVPLLALSQPFLAYAAVLSDALRGAGATRLPVGVTLLGMLAVRLPLVLWLGLGLGWGTLGVWTASSADWVLRALLCIALFASPLWTRGAVGRDTAEPAPNPS